MALVSLYTFTTSINTEQSLTTDTGGPDADTNPGEFQATLDLVLLAAGDIFQFAVYEKTISGGTQRLVYLAYFSDVQGTALWQSPKFTLSWGWDMTLKKLAGTNRSIPWTVWQHLPALSPTTDGRKLDVTTTGEAGVDWANVGAPTTTLALTGTTIGTLTTYTGNTVQTGDVYPKVDTEIADIQARLPAALTANGNMKSSMVEILTTALTETAGLLAGGFKKFFNIAAPASTMDVVARVTLTDTVTTYSGNTVQTGDSFARIGATGSGLTTLATQASVDTVDDFLDTEITAIKAKTDLIPAAPAAVGDIPTAVQNADALLDRNMATGTDSGGRTVRNGLRFLRNKWTVVAGTLSVKKEDDATEAWSSTLTADATANPIIGSDPG